MPGNMQIAPRPSSAPLLKWRPEVVWERDYIIGGPTKSRNGETRNGKREMGNGKRETGNENENE